MENFDQKIKNIKKGKSKVGYILLIVAIFLILLGIIFGSEDKDSWKDLDKSQEESEYCKARISYLVGPFAENTENGEVVESLYIAFYETENSVEKFIVATKGQTNLPVWGVTVTEENVEAIEPITIYGCTKKLEKEPAQFLAEFANDLYQTDEVSADNYGIYFGDYYLDTKDQGDWLKVVFYVMGGTIAFISIISIISNKKVNKSTEENLKKLEENGDLKAFEQEYNRASTIEYKRIKLILTENYICSFNRELVVIPFSNIVNAYCSNMIDGVYQQFRYITIETKEGAKHYIAQKAIDAKVPEFDEALSKIKSKVKLGGF